MPRAEDSPDFKLIRCTGLEFDLLGHKTPFVTVVDIVDRCASLVRIYINS
jgi:hypothetical protein